MTDLQLLSVKSNLRCKLVMKIVVNRCECLCVNIKCNNGDCVRYLLAYRPPVVNFAVSVELFNTIFECLKDIKLHIIR